MKIKVQDLVPYRESLKWKIMANYYQNKGGDAWLKGDVPFDITSNSYAAFQNASLVFSAIENMEARGQISPREKIYVIEFGSGLGLFAFNFIKQFEKINTEKNTNYFNRLVYFFSDFSEKNLLDASKKSAFQNFLDQGIIKFVLSNPTTPEEMKDVLTGEKIIPPKFVASLANYLHCVLPLTIIRKENNNYFELNTELFYEDEKKELTKKEILQMINKSLDNDFLKKISENSEYKPLEENVFLTPLHEKVFKSVLTNLNNVNVTYPFTSFLFLENFLPLLKPGGINIIFDKSYSNNSCFTNKSCEASLHGNSFAHMVELPMLAAFGEKIGYKYIYTDNDDFSVQPIVFYLGPNHKLTEDFKKLFLDQNLNQDSSDFIEAGSLFTKEANFRKAASFLKRALKIRPEDPRIFYKFSFNYLNAGFPEKALPFLEEGIKNDLFQIFDFDLQFGRYYYQLSEYDLAIKNYQNSVIKYGECSAVYYNIALCLIEKAEYKEAKSILLLAKKLEPESLDIEKLLQNLIDKTD